MTKILFITLMMIGFSASANSSGGLKLVAHVPLKAHVQVHQSTDSVRVENQSSKELKFEVSNRSPASFVTVSAP